MKKYLCFLLCMAALALPGCGSEEIIPDQTYTSKLGFSANYTTDCTIEEHGQGVDILLPSGGVKVGIYRENDVVNLSEAAESLGISEDAQGQKDISLAPSVDGKEVKVQSGSGKEKQSATIRYGILDGNLYSVNITQVGRASSSETKLANKIADSFRFTDEKLLTPQNINSKNLNVNLTVPGDCTVLEDDSSILVLLPGEKVMLELLALPYGDEPESIVGAIKDYYRGLGLKRNLKVQRDEKNPNNGMIFSMDYTDGNENGSITSHFTAFGGRVYTMGIKGEKEQITRWKPKLEAIMNTFSFVSQSAPDPLLDLIKERSITSVLGEPLPKSDPLPDSHFSTAALIGDSLTYGFEAYQIDIPPIILANQSVSVGQFATAASINTSRGKVTMLDALLDVKPEKVYIMLGINSMGMAEQAFMRYYSEMLNEIKEKLPSAEIYVQSILPVSAGRSMSGDTINNERINRYNKQLLEMCWQQEIYYVDVAEAFRDANGNMPEHLSADGIHIGPNSYKVWYDYLKTHHK